jgi:predicted lipid-binding transport protein (Tim44 family)
MTAPSLKEKNVHVDAEFLPSEKPPTSDAQSAVQAPPISSAGAFKRAVGTMVRWITIGVMAVVTLAWIAMLVWLLASLVRQII